jgi:ATP-dependent helicase HepA
LELGRDLGRILLSLADDASPFLVRRAARDVASRLPEDPVVRELVQSLEAEAPNPDDLADLRQHLADTYRVHQRLVRARRRDASVYFRTRGVAVDGRREHVRSEVDEDLRWPEILVGIEDWRDAIRTRYEDNETSRRIQALELLRGLDDLGSDLSLTPPVTAPHNLHDALARDPGDRTKATVAVDVVRALFQRLRQDGLSHPKVVAFGSSTALVEASFSALQEEGVAAVFLRPDARADEIDAAVLRFQTAAEPSVFLSDRSGEDGLNLSFADAILHLDLPFSVSRIEQRIGRLDRFGRTKSRLRQRILLPTDDDLSPWAAWLEVLEDGFGIFETSASDVQFVLPQLEAELADAFVMRGADGLREMIGTVRDRLIDARRAADEQYALDAIALGDDGAALVERMEDAELDEAALQRTGEDWLITALQMQRRRLDRDDEVSYAWRPETLIPRKPWEAEFAVDARRPCTWRRTVAMWHGATLLRPGALLIDAMERHLRWDDRGSAFATWRVAPALRGDDVAWFGFRFCFVVEPDLAGDLQVFREIDAPGLARRAQAFLPPWSQVHYADLAGEGPDAHLLAILQRPYSNQTGERGGRDFNLGSRPELMANIMTAAAFTEACKTSRARAETAIRDDPSFTARVHAGVRSAARDQRRRRRMADGGVADGAAEVLDAVRRPRLRLDSMGFIVLSRDPPARAA